ncbi:MAG TPA: curli-like amyloid fiber formation chaperone CsgH [Devosiaceae bacterium]|jgi:hypothetical protein|nr:curli-like amyloid fiber formation chaperone CsgH [Devosiaceae bacterium]
MIKSDRRLTSTAAAVLGLAVAGLAAAGSHAGAAGVQCGVETRTANGMTSIEGVLHAAAPVDGAYTFKIASNGPGGRSNVSQGGRFSAGANESLTLGRATLNSNASIDVVFEVNANGVDIDCSKQTASLS